MNAICAICDKEILNDDYVMAHAKHVWLFFSRKDGTDGDLDDERISFPICLDCAK